MKHKISKLLSILLTLVVLVGMLPITAFTTENDGEIAIPEDGSNGTVDISGTICWQNQEKQNSDDHPTSVILTLYANGTSTETTQTVTAPADGSTSWSFTFCGLAAEDENGTIIYTVTQNAVDGYTTTYSDDTLTITNSYTQTAPVEPEVEKQISLLPPDSSATVDVSGTVIWVNQEQQSSSSRPTSVTLTLYANGVATETTQTVAAPSGGGANWPYSFKNLPAANEDGIITYTVVQNAVTGYETTYSADTLTITNSYTGGVPSNHTFKHIDVRIAGASLEVQHVIKDANGTVISRKAETITVSVTKVESVKINGVTYAGSGFTKSGTYEFRKTSGVSISSKDLTSSSTAILIVDLIDADGKTYDNVSIEYGLGGIMAAAYECDGYKNSRFDGLDFVVGDVHLLE